jgi:AcrR family transcriptional regulator
MCAKTGRAKPLPRDDRRAAIIDAVLPLLLENGAAVTTAEIAEAAGIAEGTIFRAFPDKASLLHEAVKATMNPLPLREALWQIPPDGPLETQLLAAARSLADYFQRVAALIGMLRGMSHGIMHPAEGVNPRRYASESLEAITADLAGIIGQHRDELRIEPARVAVALRGLVFVNTHPLFAPDDKLTIEEIVTVLLDGVSTRDHEESETVSGLLDGVPDMNAVVT